MTSLDPSIILEGGQINDPGRMMSLQELALKLKGQQQQIDAQNTIKKLFSDPRSYDPTTGTLAPQALRSVMAADPATGMELMKDQAQLQETKLKRAGQIQDIVAPTRDAALNAYDGVISAGGSPEQAQMAGQKALDEGIGQIRTSGMLSDPEAQGLRTKFDYAPMRASALSYKDQQTLDEKRKSDERQDKRLDLSIAASERAAEAPVRAEEKAIEGKWEVLNDKDGTPYRYNPVTAQATTLKGDPYEPQGASRLPSSATAHVDMNDPGDKSYIESIAKYQVRPPSSSRNPEYRKAVMEAVVGVNPSYRENEFDTISKAMKDFSTGRQGQAINSFNVGISHLNTLDGLAKALDNGNVQTINAIANRVADETGNPAPSNFDAAKSIVGDEIAKAVIGAGSSALGDRDEIKSVINSKKTPAELAGVIKTYKDLMAGQLKGLKKQYEDTTKLDDFDERLAPETKTELGMGDKKADDGWSVTRVK